MHTIPSMLAVILLLLFLNKVFSCRDDIDNEFIMASVFVAYVLTLMGFIGLFVCTLSYQVYDLSLAASVVIAVVTSFFVGATLHLRENKNKQTFLEWLWSKRAHRPMVVSHTILVLAGPFIAIFTIESRPLYGYIWFIGLIFITSILIRLAKFIDSAIEHTRVDEY